MISLETAQKIRDAGLKWELQLGDIFSYGDPELFSIHRNGKERLEPPKHLLVDAIHLPRLDQLLAEIEKRGWTWEAESQEDNGHYSVRVRQGNIFNRTWADTPEEAAAQALIWILIKQGGTSR